MPRNVLAHKTNEQLAMEYAIRVTSTGVMPTKLYNSLDIHDEMVCRIGVGLTNDYIDEARQTLKLLGE